MARLSPVAKANLSNRVEAMLGKADVLVAKAGEWSEELHPRGEGGRFAAAEAATRDASKAMTEANAAKNKVYEAKTPREKADAGRKAAAAYHRAAQANAQAVQANSIPGREAFADLHRGLVRQNQKEAQKTAEKARVVGNQAARAERGAARVGREGAAAPKVDHAALAQQAEEQSRSAHAASDHVNAMAEPGPAGRSGPTASDVSSSSRQAHATAWGEHDAQAKPAHEAAAMAHASAASTHRQLATALTAAGDHEGAARATRTAEDHEAGESHHAGKARLPEAGFGGKYDARDAAREDAVLGAKRALDAEVQSHPTLGKPDPKNGDHFGERHRADVRAAVDEAVSKLPPATGPTSAHEAAIAAGRAKMDDLAQTMQRHASMTPATAPAARSSTNWWSKLPPSGPNRRYTAAELHPGLPKTTAAPWPPPHVEQAVSEAKDLMGPALDSHYNALRSGSAAAHREAAEANERVVEALQRSRDLGDPLGVDPRWAAAEMHTYRGYAQMHRAKAG